MGWGLVLFFDFRFGGMGFYGVIERVCYGFFVVGV